MRPPGEANEVDRAALANAYGRPAPVPRQLRTVYSTEREEAADAVSEL